MQNLEFAFHILPDQLTCIRTCPLVNLLRLSSDGI